MRPEQKETMKQRGSSSVRQHTATRDNKRVQQVRCIVTRAPLARVLRATIPRVAHTSIYAKAAEALNRTVQLPKSKGDSAGWAPDCEKALPLPSEFCFYPAAFKYGQYNLPPHAPACQAPVDASK
jgi:hypothetical protein